MNLRYLFFLFVSLIAIETRAQDWPQWRGPEVNNHAAPGASAPLNWSEDSGLAWKTAIPGRGNSSPTLVGNRIYLTTGDESKMTQSLLILDRESGKLLNEVVTHTDGLPEGVHGKNTHANSSVASDGKRVFAMFLNDEAPIVTAYDLEGQQLWQRRVCGPTRVRYVYGFGSSPIIVDGLVVVATEFSKDDSGLYAFDAETGETVWFAPRPKQFSYSTPTPAKIDGIKVLLMCGNNRFGAYDAKTGEELWMREGPTMATVGTMVWDSKLKLGFASGGHPDNFTAAVNLTGEHEIVWQHPVKCYEQSLLTFEGYVLAVADIGVAYCWRASDGKEMWRQKLRGNYSSSPLLVDGRIYVVSEAGDMFVFEANPEEYVELAKNKLGDIAYATPTPADGRLYHRYVKDSQEYLVAIGQ